MEEFGQSALIAITGLMVSAALVAGSVVLAPPDGGPPADDRGARLANLPAVPPNQNWPDGPASPLSLSTLPQAEIPSLALPPTPRRFESSQMTNEGRMHRPSTLAVAPPRVVKLSPPKRDALAETPQTQDKVTVAGAAPQNAALQQVTRPDRTSEDRPNPAPVPPIAPKVSEPDRAAKPAPHQRNGTVPQWRKYAALTTIDESLPMIAIIIDDLGLNRRRMARTIALPTPLTLAILPYGEGLPAMAAKARAAGHELMLHLPMQPRDDKENPGPNALLVNLDRAELERRIRWSLARFDGFVGVNNHMGSLFTANEQVLAPLMSELRERGLLFLDSVTSGASVAGDLAHSYGIPSAKRDIFLDNDISVASIEKQLAKVERCARRRGQCIAIGHPYNETLEVLSRWLPTLRRKGFNLVPISAIVARRRTG